jgi:preprotein translocase subunit YajC
MNNLVLLQTNAAAGGGQWTFLIMMLLIFVVMYFFMIRPQQKKQKELAKFRENLKKGDKVITLGGIYGTITDVRETTLLIEVDSNVKIKVDKSSVVKDISDIQK